MPTPNALGDRIRGRRTALGLTLAEVAERAGLSIPYVSNLERGRRNPTVDAVRALAVALETSASALVGENEEAFDPLELVLAQAPKSLRTFSKSERFNDAATRLARQQGVAVDEMRQKLLVGMASAPRRSKGEPTEDDWRRLVDVYSLILTER
jgi:transcriptional regulator with XRE-family HTH domain